MLSREEVLNLATLARLKLGEGEVESLQKDISNILEYVGQVSAVSVKSEQGPTFLKNVMREDLPVGEAGAPAATLGMREELIRAFPKSENNYNVVRKIIQKD